MMNLKASIRTFVASTPKTRGSPVGFAKSSVGDRQPLVSSLQELEEVPFAHVIRRKHPLSNNKPSIARFLQAPKGGPAFANLVGEWDYR